MKKTKTKKVRKVKILKGYMFEYNLQRGWRGKDHAFMIYRKISPTEKDFIPVEIHYSL